MCDKKVYPKFLLTVYPNTQLNNIGRRTEEMSLDTKLISIRGVFEN